MINLLPRIVFSLLCVFYLTDNFAQDIPKKGWDAPKIKGTRQEIYSIYEGKPYFTDNWCLGKIQLVNGESIDSLYLKYSSFKDELIYFNPKINAQIKIDKAIISAFTFTDEYGQSYSFKKYPFDNYAKSDRYFEILAVGDIDLLCYKKVDLNEVPPYHDTKGILKNMAYRQGYLYYFYTPQNGFASVKPSKSGLLSRFNKEAQRPIKKLLRKNKIYILDELSFIEGWKTIEKAGFKVMF